MKSVEINGELVCTCEPVCDDCDRRFRCLDAGVTLPKMTATKNLNDTCDFSHPLSMVVVNNQAELAYMQKWFDLQKRDCGWMGERDKFPIALSLNGGTWTDHMDRALYYVPFKKFIAKS